MVLKFFAVFLGVLAAAWCTVGMSQVPPTVTAAFNPATVTVGGSKTTTFTITIANPNSSAVPLDSVHITNTYPAGLVPDQIGSYTCGGVAAPGNPGGTAGGSGSFTANGFDVTANTLQGGDSCTIVVLMHATMTGPITDTTSNTTSVEAPPSAPASATLTVTSLPVTLQSFDVN